jgi:hypothetical protein
MSRQTIEIPPAPVARINRSMSPATPTGWVQPEDPATAITREIGDWFKQLSEAEGLFKKHIYGNENINESDIRQHRCHLCALLAEGELLALNVLILSEQTNLPANEFKPVVDTIDQKVKKLYGQLFEYHGPIESQPDIPESFKQATREVNEGKLEDMDV